MGKSKKQVAKEIDYIGGILSVSGLILFLAGLQWGGYQYPWTSVHVLVPLLLGVVFIIAFIIWESFFAPHPMFPGRIKQDPRVLVLTLIITFISGMNFFAAIMFWPTQAVSVSKQLSLRKSLIRTLVQCIRPQTSTSRTSCSPNWHLHPHRCNNHPLAAIGLPRPKQGTHDHCQCSDDCRLVLALLIPLIACTNLIQELPQWHQQLDSTSTTSGVTSSSPALASAASWFLHPSSLPSSAPMI